MADVLLTHSNHLYSDPKQVRKMEPYPPLQTLLAAACLRREGFEVALFDTTFTSPEEAFKEALDRHRPLVVAICEDNFNFLTKMCLANNRRTAFLLTQKAKESGIPVLVNGSDATDNARSYLEAGADAVIMGELEVTLLEVVRRLEGGQMAGAEDVPGLAYLDPRTESFRQTARREPMEDLGWLPTPDWGLVDVESYRDAWCRAHGYFSLNLVSSRGCPYRCNWCAKPIYGDSYQFRSPQAVAEEMAYIKVAYSPDRIWFADDIFALSGRWTESFAREVQIRQAQIPFKIQSRCDLMTRDTVAALRSAGCAEAWMGVESGSQKVLDAMDKGIRVEQVYEARENLRGHGIRACFFLQFGYGGESWQDIQQTVKVIRDTQPDEIGVSVSYPLAGTKFYDTVAAQLDGKTNWSDSDDLAMMFPGTYKTEFYKALRDALHFEVDAINGKVANGDGRRRLAELWQKVEELEGTCANPLATVPWTSC